MHSRFPDVKFTPLPCATAVEPPLTAAAGGGRSSVRGDCAPSRLGRVSSNGPVGRATREIIIGSKHLLEIEKMPLREADFHLFVAKANRNSQGLRPARSGKLQGEQLLDDVVGR